MKYINIKYLTNFILCLCIKFILEYIYVKYVTFFSFEGYTLDYDTNHYLIGFVCFIITFYICNSSNSNLLPIINLFFLTYILPNIVFYSLANQNTTYFISLVLSFNFIILSLGQPKRLFTLKTKFSNKDINFFFFFICLICLFHYVISVKGNFVFNLSRVYDFRREFGSVSGQGIWAYINSIVPKILLVYLFSISVFNKKRYAIFFYLGIFLLFFMFSGHKGVLKGIPLVLFFYFIYKYKIGLTKFYISFFLFLVFIFIVGSHNSVIGALLIRRLLFLPVLLNFKYFEFFSENPQIYWSNGILKSFLNYPYDLPATHVIGNYMGDPDVGANTGYIGSGFMHSGYIGILIYTLLLILILRFINSAVVKFNNVYMSYALLYVALNSIIVSSDLLTSMLTHGVFVLLLLLLVMKKQTNV